MKMRWNIDLIGETTKEKRLSAITIPYLVAIKRTNPEAWEFLLEILVKVEEYDKDGKTGRELP